MPRPTKKKSNIYFDEPIPDVYESSVEKFTSGCTLLDLILGGGWAESRMINIVGDKSTGKSLLAIEAFCNFIIKYPDGVMMYHEAEAAFDTGYARRIGMPVDNIDFVSKKKKRIDTVEGLYNKLNSVIKTAKKPTLYILDSLDALTDEAEKKKAIEKKDYNRKAAVMSELFRKMAARLSDSNVTFIIISQVRDNIGVMFGRDWKRSGGRAMDFYASQVIILATKGELKRKIEKVERSYGMKIRALNDKNKAGEDKRYCDFSILKKFGMDDIQANISWLNEIEEFKTLKDMGLNLYERNDKGKLEVIETKDRKSKITKFARRMNSPKYYDKQFQDELSSIVKELWLAIEKKFEVGRQKYD